MTQKGFKRKLTSIFNADAVGYSRLMGDDEAATVRTLTFYLKNHLLPCFLSTILVMILHRNILPME
jgi:hypothetical protein